MTKDYAPPSTTRSAKKKPSAKSKSSKNTKKAGAQPSPPPESKGRGKLFLGLIILLGAFGYGLYFLQSVPPAAPLEEDKQSVSKKNSQTSSNAADEKEAETQRFKFYDLLPQTEVVPPKVSAYQYKEKAKDEEYYYVVQTGSFKSLADAERQKAMIAFQGLKGTIKSIESKSGTTWHRVSTGPFYTRTDMNGALDKLVSIDIEPLVKKIKKDN